MPPPYGGVANWVLLLQKYESQHPDLRIDYVNTAPSWRAVDDLAAWKRVVGGGLQLARDYLHILRIFRDRPDVVHLNTSASYGVVRDIAVLWTARCRKIPTVYHLRFGRVAQIAQQNRLEWRVFRRALRLSTVVIALDQGTADTVQKQVPDTQVVRIPNAFDPGDLPVVLEPQISSTVLFLGWVIPTKGVTELVDAWAELDSSGWRCVIAGPGSQEYREDLLHRFAPRNLEFLGEQPHEAALALLAASAISVLPSYSEGFPNSVLEAMALGKAIVATEVGAIPEMLSGDCGLLVPPQDSESLRLALEELMADEALRQEMGLRAQARASEEYGMDTVFRKLVQTWIGAARTSEQ